VGLLAEYFTDETTLLRTGPQWGLNLILATPWNHKFVPQLREYLNYIHSVSEHVRYFMPITSHDCGAPAQEFGSADSKDPSFLLALDALGQNWIGEVPKNFSCWPVPPKYQSPRKQFASKQVYNVARWSLAFISQNWRAIVFPRQTVEPTVWEVKAAQVHLVSNGRPTDRTYWLIVAWNRATDEHKYFVSNAPPRTKLDLLLKVAFRRAEIEHLFRLAKDQVGLDHFEGRSYVGLMRHMILCQLILLFLAEQTLRLNAELATTAALPAPQEKKTIRPDACTSSQDLPLPGPADCDSDPAAYHPGTDGRRAEHALCRLA
jgi:hypothetical protein